MRYDIPRFRKILEEKTSYNSVTGCWEFQLIDNHGYGYITIDHVQHRVHVLSAKLFFGYKPRNQTMVCHNCSSRNCWNPDHIYIGNHESNMRDMAESGGGKNQNSDKIHCKREHPLSGRNLKVEFGSDGVVRRICRECKRIDMQLLRERKRNLKIVS